MSPLHDPPKRSMLECYSKVILFAILCLRRRKLLVKNQGRADNQPGGFRDKNPIGAARVTPVAFRREQHGSQAYQYVRRLVAVAYGDVVGYSKLMCEDEDRTVARWLEVRHEVIEAKAKKYRGRVVNVIGDSVLLEFENVLDAVAWSRDVPGHHP